MQLSSHPLILLLQQAPPSKLQFGLLFSSSHHLSLAYCGLPQPDGVGVEVVVAKAIETGIILSIMDVKKQTFMYIFHRSIFTEIREFATIVLWKLVINFGV